MSAASGQRERTCEHRRRTLRAGQIIDGSGAALRDRAIKNVSERGEKLMLGRKRNMPDLLRLDSRRPAKGTVVTRKGQPCGQRQHLSEQFGGGREEEE